MMLLACSFNIHAIGQDSNVITTDTTFLERLVDATTSVGTILEKTSAQGLPFYLSEKAALLRSAQQTIHLSQALAQVYGDSPAKLMDNIVRLPSEGSQGDYTMAIIREFSVLRLERNREIPPNYLSYSYDSHPDVLYPGFYSITVDGPLYGLNTWIFAQDGTIEMLKGNVLPSGEFDISGSWSIDFDADGNKGNIVINEIALTDLDSGKKVVSLPIEEPVSEFYAELWPKVIPIPPKARKQTLVIDIATGGYHSLVLLDNYRIMGAGSNEDGQLGLYDTEKTSIFKEISQPFTAIDANARYSLAMRSDGSLWGWGANEYGQLGISDFTSIPYPVNLLDDVMTMSAGWYHSMAITKDGRLWATGANRNGQLGNKTATDIAGFVPVASNMKEVACGGYHSLALDTDGVLWATGNNAYGQLGDNTLDAKTTFVKVAEHVVSIAAGAFHSLYIDKDGQLWATGANEEGQLGNGNQTDSHSFIKVADDVVTVSAGRNHSAYIDGSDRLWVMGDNRFGQADGFAYQPNVWPYPVMENVKNVCCGWYHNMVLTNDNQVITTGYHGSGQLGVDLPEWESGPVFVELP